MERKSVFVWADNEAGFVQAVIATRDFPEFKKRGFVAAIEEIKATEKAKAPKNTKRPHNDPAAN